MTKLSLLFCFVLAFCQAKAQNNKEQQQVRSIMLQAYEAVSQPTRQWFADVSLARDLDSAYIRRKLKERFGTEQLVSGGELFACMIAFQQMLNKEARNDRKVEQHIKRSLLASKAEKLKMENEAIDQGMKEAGEKASRAMDAASTALVTAIVSGLVQIGFATTANSGRKKDSIVVYINKLELQLVKFKQEGKKKVPAF